MSMLGNIPNNYSNPGNQDFINNLISQIQQARTNPQAQNAQLAAQLSQNAQTQTLINTLRPVAQPAYITCSPYESVYGYNRGCGCGNCGF